MFTLLYNSCEVNTQEQTQMIIALTLKSLRRPQDNSSKDKNLYKHFLGVWTNNTGHVRWRHCPYVTTSLGLSQKRTEARQSGQELLSALFQENFCAWALLLLLSTDGGKCKSDLKITIHMFHTKGRRCSMFIKTHQIIFSPSLFKCCWEVYLMLSQLSLTY